MIDFGTNKFISERDNFKVEMTLVGQSSLTEMCEMFESFLRAIGYEFDGMIDIIEVDRNES